MYEQRAEGPPQWRFFCYEYALYLLLERQLDSIGFSPRQ